MKKYIIVTNDLDHGTDEKTDHETMKEAMKAARAYKKEYESVFIYDQIKRAVRHAFNGFPDSVFSKDVDTSRVIYHW